MASSLSELVKIHFDEPFMTQVLVYYAQSDIDDIRNKVLPNLINFIRLVNPDK